MKTFDIERLIPKFLLNDTNCNALAKGIQAGVRYMNETVSESKRYLSDIEKMRSERLDDLLWEMDIEPVVSITDDEKRKLIRNAIDIGKRAGTAYGLCEYIDAIAKYTYAGNVPDDVNKHPAGVVIVTDEGLTHNDFINIGMNHERYHPIYENIETLQGQTVSYSCRAWVQINGNTLSEKAVVMKDMKSYIDKTLGQKYGNGNVKLTVDDTEKTLTKYSHQSYEKILLYDYTTEDKGKEFTKVAITDADDEIIVERDMQATVLSSQHYYLKVFAHYNDDLVPECSMDLSGNSAEWLMANFNTRQQMAYKLVWIKYTDGIEQISSVNQCTKTTYSKHGWYVSRYTFNIGSLSVGKRIKSVMFGSGMGLLGNLYLFAEPDSYTYSIVSDANTSITFCIAVKCDGHPSSELDAFILDFSSIE